MIWVGLSDEEYAGYSGGGIAVGDQYTHIDRGRPMPTSLKYTPISSRNIWFLQSSHLALRFHTFTAYTHMHAHTPFVAWHCLVLGTGNCWHVCVGNILYSRCSWKPVSLVLWCLCSCSYACEWTRPKLLVRIIIICLWDAFPKVQMLWTIWT